MTEETKTRDPSGNTEDAIIMAAGIAIGTKLVAILAAGPWPAAADHATFIAGGVAIIFNVIATVVRNKTGVTLSQYVKFLIPGNKDAAAK